MDFAYPRDIANEFPQGLPPQVDDGYLAYLIAGAQRKLSRRLGDLGLWADTTDRVETLRDVIVEMVSRVVRAGGSIYRSESDSGYSYTVDARMASGLLWVTEENWADLTGDSAPMVGIVRLSVPEWSPRRTW